MLLPAPRRSHRRAVPTFLARLAAGGRDAIRLNSWTRFAAQGGQVARQEGERLDVDSAELGDDGLDGTGRLVEPAHANNAGTSGATFGVATAATIDLVRRDLPW